MIVAASATQEDLMKFAVQYNSEGRVYHSWVHIREGCATLNEYVIRGVVAKPREVLWAWLFHDYIYEVGAEPGANEYASANQAVNYLQNAGLGIDIDYMRVLILATALYDLRTDEYDQAIGELKRLYSVESDSLLDDCHIISDVDLASFRAPYDAFCAIQVRVDEEFRPVYGDAYDAGRADFMRSMLDSGPLFRSRFTDASMNEVATSNITRYIEEHLSEGSDNGKSSND